MVSIDGIGILIEEVIFSSSSNRSFNLGGNRITFRRFNFSPCHSSVLFRFTSPFVNRQLHSNCCENSNYRTSNEHRLKAEEKEKSLKLFPQWPFSRQSPERTPTSNQQQQFNSSLSFCFSELAIPESSACLKEYI